jgi:YebC/PmpR family DNA-binding regulatory protein
MGRIFETRKHVMFARWNKMAKAFTRIAKDIAIAVKSGGPSPDSNPALRRFIQNARAANMPMEKVDSAIKRANGEDTKAYEVVVYEGYAPHGIALLVETATDNVTRTVANVRSIFKKHEGNFGSAGSVAFMFQRMGVFHISPADPAMKDLESVELELIDHGLEELGEGTNDKGEKQIIIRCAFNDFGRLQSALEARKIHVLSAESEYIPQNTTELPEAHATLVLELVDALEQDEDVQKVFHNLS